MDWLLDPENLLSGQQQALDYSNLINNLYYDFESKVAGLTTSFTVLYMYLYHG